MRWFSSSGDDEFRRASEESHDYDRRPDRSRDESDRLEQAKHDASKSASWWAKFND